MSLHVYFDTLWPTTSTSSWAPERPRFTSRHAADRRSPLGVPRRSVEVGGSGSPRRIAAQRFGRI